MVVTVVADVVDAALLDLGAGVGVLVDDLARHHEGGRHVLAVEQVEDSGQTRADVVVAARDRARRIELERASPECLGVEVDRERERAAVLALPEAQDVSPSGAVRPWCSKQAPGTDLGRHVLRLCAKTGAVLELNHRYDVLPAGLEHARAGALRARLHDLARVLDALRLERLLDAPARVTRELVDQAVGETTAM